MTSAVASQAGHGLDRSLFQRPIAHRGLHRRAKGLIENTAPAFRAAIKKSYGIECDLQAARDGTPMVFHDDRLDRLVEASGRVDALPAADLMSLRYKHQETTILSFAELLALVDGRVPLLVEVKRNARPPPRSFLEHIAKHARAYHGPLALMSFDRDMVAALGRLAPGVPRGWIVGYRQLPARWWAAPRTARRDAAVARLLASAPLGISFLSSDLRLLPSVRAWLTIHAPHLFLVCWTVRTKRQRVTAARWADAPTFEGYEP